MKLLHLADLHFGKRLFDVSLKDDQEYIVSQILTLIAEEEPDALLISGDVYDKAQPSAESVAMFDRFLTSLREFPCEVFIVAGNHDSPARLAYAATLLSSLRIQIAGRLEGLPPVYTLPDTAGPVHFILLPFFRLHEVKALWPEETESLNSYSAALRFVLGKLDLPPGERRVLLSHQHYSGSLDSAQESDSELNIVGGLDPIAAEILTGFDYAALGHLHRPQSLGTSQLRYAGSPLAYSFSEIRQTKSVPVIELGEPGCAAEIRLRELTPLRQVRELKGSLAEVISAARNLPESERQDFLRVILTDEERLDNPLRRLQAWYPNVLQLQLERDRQTLADQTMSGQSPLEGKGAIELFTDFYKEQTGLEISVEDKALLDDLWHKMTLETEVEARG